MTVDQITDIVRNGILALNRHCREPNCVRARNNLLSKIDSSLAVIPVRIIVHHSLTRDSRTVSWSAIRRYHTQTKGWPNVGYHYGVELIGDDYEVLVGCPVDVTGTHCRDHNTGSIGVCVVGNFDVEDVPDKQWEVAVKHVATLASVFGIEVEDIYGDREFHSGKTCPGMNFDLDKFREEVGRHVIAKS